MSQLTLEIPDKILEPFKTAAQRQHKRVEQLIIEQLTLISGKKQRGKTKSSVVSCITSS